MSWEVIGLIIVLFFVCFLVYSHFSSPLKHIPSPSSIPILGETLELLVDNDHEKVIATWNENYKDIGLYRLRSIISALDCVHIVNPDWVKHILSRPEEFPRSKTFKTFFPLLGEALFGSAGDYHRFQRRVLGPAFTSTHLKNYVPMFDEHAKVLCDVWENRLKEVGEESVNINVRDFLYNFSFDIIAQVAFGYKSNSQTTEPNEFVLALRGQAEVLMNTVRRFIMNFAPTLFTKTHIRSAEKVLHDVLERRKEKILMDNLEETEKTDLLSVMINSVDEKTGDSFTDQLIKDSCFSFLIAGFETTATAIPIALYHLAMFPEMQMRAREEIENVLKNKPTDQPMSSEDTDKLIFTTAFIKESLRYCVTVPRTSRKTTKECVFGDYRIPPGTLLLFTHNTVNRDGNKFDHPDEFLPERWMEGSNIKCGTTISFGYGPFSCIGKQFALQEIKVAIARLLQRFKLSVDPEFQKFSIRSVITVKFKPEIHIRFQSVL